MTKADGEAQGMKRASEPPKSTTYGRQNPITERRNSESQLILYRSAWADIVNLHLERIGSTERVDHRSHAERGLDEQPTIHEDAAARAMEKKSVISDRCAINRQITTLTEEIEELRTEKENLLLDLGCADDAGIKAVQSEVTAMEVSLHKLDVQKEKYSAELDETLQPYKQLQSQAEEEDQQKIRIDAAAAAAVRLQQAYGKHYNAQLARESQQDVAAWLGELTQPASIREFLHHAEKKTHSAPKHSKDTPER